MEKRDRLYIIGEDPNSPFPILNDWHKIGISDCDAGLNKGPDDWYERTRALNQGNPRGLVAKRWWKIKGSARNFEKEVHKELQQRNIKNRYDESKATGHGEWWNVTEEEAIEIIEEVFDRQYRTTLELFTSENGDSVSIGY